MSVSSFNPYDLLDENGGDRVRKAPKPKPVVAAAPKPVEAPKVQQEAAKPKAAPAKAAAAPAKNAASANAAKKEGDAKPRPQGDAQKGNKPAGKDGAPRKPQQPRNQQQQGAAPVRGLDEAAAEKPRERRDRDHRTHDKPHNRGRQFDRRSGTGRPANETKRGGSGKNNWGNELDGQETVEQPTKEVAEGEKEEAVPAEGEVAAAETETEAAPPKEPEKEYLTLDEYLATKKGKGVTSVEAPKIRQAGEGVDQSAWAAYETLSKDEEESAAVTKPKKEAKASDKVSIDKFFQVIMSTPEGSDRRGRGPRGPPRDNRGARGGRGQGPRFGDRRGPRVNNNAKPDATATNGVSLGDNAQFPSLGGSPAPVKA